MRQPENTTATATGPRRERGVASSADGPEDPPGGTRWATYSRDPANVCG
jgi:hypothetical protein